MSESNQIVPAQPFPKASTELALSLGIEPKMMIETLKAQCFVNQRPDQVSDAQLAAFVSVANGLKVNPLVPGMLYAYPQRNGGITPILGPDGTLKKLDEQISDGKLTGYECDVFPDDVTQKPTHAIARIYRAGSDKPAQYTAIFSEWVVGSNPNWQTRPRHMLWIRAIKQAARQVIHGLPMDADEYKLSEMLNVTPEGAAPVAEPVQEIKRAPGRPRKSGLTAATPIAPEVVTYTEEDQQAAAEALAQLEAAKKTRAEAESARLKAETDAASLRRLR